MNQAISNSINPMTTQTANPSPQTSAVNSVLTELGQNIGMNNKKIYILIIVVLSVAALLMFSILLFLFIRNKLKNRYSPSNTHQLLGSEMTITNSIQMDDFDENIVYTRARL